jgi:hypothetical protein
VKREKWREAIRCNLRYHRSISVEELRRFMETIRIAGLRAGI